MSTAMRNYFVFSNYINAWSIHKGLIKLGLDLQCVSRRPGLLPLSSQRPARGDVLFFTEERSLLRFSGSDEFHCYPRQVNAFTDDKLELSRFLLSIAEKPIPFWELSSKYATEPPELPVYLKARHSWVGDQNLVRGYVCDSPVAFAKASRDIERQGQSLRSFFWQRLVLGDLIHHVGGFFDCERPQRNLLLVQRKVLGTRAKMSTCAIVKTGQDPEDLLGRTKHILTEMRYRGPFEFEFIYDVKSRTYYLLELNPRFWMQHGIFVDFYDNGLLKRYLDIDSDQDWCPSHQPDKPVVWANSIHACQSLLRGRLSAVRKYLEMHSRHLTGEVTMKWYPDWPAVFRNSRALLGRAMPVLAQDHEEGS